MEWWCDRLVVAARWWASSGRMGNRWRWKWRQPVNWMTTILTVLFHFLVQQSLAMKNENYPITTLCQKSQRNFLSNIPVKVIGAVITSNNERDMDCVVTFQTDSILEMFMIRFEDLKIDCNDQLQIFDGAHAHGNPKVQISCDKTIYNIGKGGIVYTQTNSLTIKYVTDSWGTDSNGFKMVISAFKDNTKGGCRDGFQCDDTDICINHALVCDGVNHCGDGGDERASQFCTPLGVHALSLLDTPILVAIVLGALFFVVAGISVYVMYTCKSREQEQQHNTENIKQQNYQTTLSGNVMSLAQSREFNLSWQQKILTCFL